MSKRKTVVVDERPVSDSFYDASDNDVLYEDQDFDEEELNAFDEKHEFYNPSLDSLNGGKYGYDDEQY